MRDYDLSETSKLIRSVYMGLAMMAFMHLYLKYVLSRFLLSYCTPITLYNSPSL